MWTQWWSFADVSQQRVDFSKKISKIKIIYWFHFHRCSHGASKIGHHFRKQSGSKIEVFKRWQQQKNLFLNWYSSMKKKIRKIRMIFDIENWLLKVRFRHFLTTHVNIWESQIKKIIFLLPIFLLKSSPCWLTSTKLHHWGHTTHNIGN